MSEREVCLCLASRLKVNATAVMLRILVLSLLLTLVAASKVFRPWDCGECPSTLGCIDKVMDDRKCCFVCLLKEGHYCTFQNRSLGKCHEGFECQRVGNAKWLGLGQCRKVEEHYQMYLPPELAKLAKGLIRYLSKIPWPKSE